MKNKCILIVLLLISFIMTSNYTCFAQQSELLVPPMLQDIKGKDELVKYLDEIGSVRSNISTINISTATASENSAEIKKQINFYLTELSSIKNSIANFEKKYSNSQPDLLFAEQINILLNAYQMSLNQQLSLLNALINNNSEAYKLFDSDYLTYIYYYLNLGDQMLSYINTFYNL